MFRWVGMALLGMVVSFTVTTGCGGAERCDYSNCAGCCDAQGLCQTGTSPAQCGARGALCNSCTGTQVCYPAGYCGAPAAETSTGLVCDAPLIQCGTQCIDVDSSVAHCGACDNACTRTQTCRAGRCVAQSTSDGGTRDGGVTDGGVSDGGTRDGGVTDGGTRDGGTSDGGVRDAEVVDAGPPIMSGVGYSVPECNGDGRVQYFGGGVTTQQYDMVTAWVYGSDPILGSGTHQIFGYSSRTEISSSRLPATGRTNEKQIKLAIVSGSNGVGVGQYQGIVALSEWDPANARWRNVATSDTAVVTIARYNIVNSAYSDGHYCAGVMVGEVQSLVSGSGSTRLDFQFVAPLLTPSFPR